MLLREPTGVTGDLGRRREGAPPAPEPSGTWRVIGTGVPTANFDPVDKRPMSCGTVTSAVLLAVFPTPSEQVTVVL
jgi:hypothetical protein